MPPDPGIERREFMRRSDVAESWGAWFAEWGTGVKPWGRNKLFGMFRERFGTPTKREGHYGWKGFKFIP